MAAPPVAILFCDHVLSDKVSITYSGMNSEAYLGLYLAVPGDYPSNPFSRWGGRGTVLGFGATHLLEMRFVDGALEEAAVYVANGEGGWANPQPVAQAGLAGKTLEVALPFTLLNPELDTGDRLSLRAVLSAGPEGAVEDVALMPEGGARLLLPGRNAALTSEDTWDWALWINGWTPTLYRVGPDGKPEEVQADGQESPVKHRAQKTKPFDLWRELRGSLQGRPTVSSQKMMSPGCPSPFLG